MNCFSMALSNRPTLFVHTYIHNIRLLSDKTTNQLQYINLKLFVKLLAIAKTIYDSRGYLYMLTN